jgi:hypothetical protein
MLFIPEPPPGVGTDLSFTPRTSAEDAVEKNDSLGINVKFDIGVKNFVEKFSKQALKRHKDIKICVICLSKSSADKKV